MATYEGTSAGENSFRHAGLHGTLGPKESPSGVGNGAANDSLYGFGGDDILQGYGGSDYIEGGDGDDSLYGYYNTAHQTVQVQVDASDTLLGGAGNDTIFGQDGDDQLFGGDDNDELYGGVGNDALYGGNGVDWLEGGSNGSDTLDGGAGDDSLMGRGDDDALDGGDGSDTAVFWGIIDDYSITRENGVIVVRDNRSQSRIDNDSYHDKVSSGTDFLSNVESIRFIRQNFSDYRDNTYSLAEILNTGTEGSDWIDGSDDGEELRGLAGDDTLLGAGGDDTLNGGSGDDWLAGGDGTDVLDGGDGIDTVDYAFYGYQAGNFSIDLAAGTADFAGTTETLISIETVYTGAEDDTLVGSSVDNTLSAGSGDNEVFGGAGNDFLRTDYGTDLLDGGLGDDSMYGGDGDDTYVVDSALDLVWEWDDAGFDTVRSSVGYRLGDNLERLVLTGTAQINGIGNALANTLIGNDGDNFLNGLGGADTMEGGLGNDIYVVNDVGDVIVETGAGTDEVRSSVSYRLAAGLETLRLTGAAAINGIGNELANTLIGNGANNLLNGLGGADTMHGGLGNDTYVVDNPGDRIVEVGAGADRVLSSVSRALEANVEALTLTGTAAINAVGNAQANTLVGNSANNVLNGRAGADLMRGGLGNDTYVVDNPGDRIVEVGVGIDRVVSSVSRVLEANVEALTLTGTAAINAVGNALNNVLVGNAANNVLNGRAGADLMRGGLGNDTYVVDNPGDRVIEVGAGADRVLSSISRALEANVEALTLTGTAAINGVGNALNNTLIGNAGNNVLSGGLGGDVLRGGLGADTLVGGAGADALQGNAGADVFAFRSIADSPGGGARDLIQDFQRGIDRIDLSVIDANGLVAGNQAFAFIGAAAFSGRAGELAYAAGTVLGDTNGDRVADLEIRVPSTVPLTAVDFIL